MHLIFYNKTYYLMCGKKLISEEGMAEVFFSQLNVIGCNLCYLSVCGVQICCGIVCHYQLPTTAKDSPCLLVAETEIIKPPLFRWV